MVGDGKNMAFISDRCSAIAKALTNVFSEADRGIWLCHLGKNMTGFKKTMVDLAKKAARVYRQVEFDEIFEVIRVKTANYTTIWKLQILECGLVHIFQEIDMIS